MIHELKTWPEYFEKVLTGEKTFEVRKDDRSFKIDDELLLMEYDPTNDKYTGRQVSKQVSYILNGPSFGIREGFCVMGFKQLPQVRLDDDDGEYYDDWYEDDYDNYYDDLKEKESEQMAEKAALCNCGAYVFNSKGDAVHVADCYCGAD